MQKLALRGNLSGLITTFTKIWEGNYRTTTAALTKSTSRFTLQTDLKNPGPAAGLACGAIWTVSKGIHDGEIVLCPDVMGAYRVAEVVGDYYYADGQILPHRRPVKWLDVVIQRSEMSEALRNSTGSIGTHCMITKYTEELVGLIGQVNPPNTITNDETIEDPAIAAPLQALHQRSSSPLHPEASLRFAPEYAAFVSWSPEVLIA